MIQQSIKRGLKLGRKFFRYHEEEIPATFCENLHTLRRYKISTKLVKLSAVKTDIKKHNH